MMKLAAAGLLVALCASAQTPKTFEVASIKPNAAGDNLIRISHLPGGRYEATGMTVRGLLQNAYSVKDFQIFGGPGWLGADRFDIRAKAADGDNVTGADFKLMLQALLADRFKVKFHHETRDEQAFALVPAKNGPKLKSVPDTGNGRIDVSRSSVRGQEMDLGSLAEMLGSKLGRIVLNKTGLPGKFDIDLKWTLDAGDPGAKGPEASAATDDLGSTLYTALQEQLGLRLDSIKAPVDVLVIESVEKPSEN